MYGIDIVQNIWLVGLSLLLVYLIGYMRGRK